MRALCSTVVRIVVLIALVLACKGDRAKQDRAAAGSGNAHGARPDVVELEMDWSRCDTALAKAANAPLAARPQIVLDGCHACGGDWKPLLTWSVEPASGGPKREQIEKLMVACDAFCTGDSKLKFMAGIDKARGQNVNTPWRQLAIACKDKVNGSPDDRFMSAPYFALDRIARAAAAQGGDTATMLAALDLPLPAITVSGAGVVLPDSDAVTPRIGELQITVLGDAIHVGHMPRAKLGAAGVLVNVDKAGYPGDAVTVELLGAKLVELVGDDKTQTITLLAPHAMPAMNLVPIIAAASTVAPIYLAANAYESPEGWQLAGAIPVAMEAGKGVAVTDEMTVQNLARELAGAAARKQHGIGVTKK